MNVDSGVAVITWHLDGLTDLNTVDITVAGTAPLEPHDIRTQMRWPQTPPSVDLIGHRSTPFG